MWKYIVLGLAVNIIIVSGEGCRGDPNAISGCDSNCTNRCPYALEPTVCTCPENSCMCKEGHYYEIFLRKCVTLDMCDRCSTFPFAERGCDSNCERLCPDSNTHYKTKQKCVCTPKTSCRCVAGYYYDIDKRMCVPPSECTIKFTSPENQNSFDCSESSESSDNSENSDSSNTSNSTSEEDVSDSDCGCDDQTNSESTTSSTEESSENSSNSNDDEEDCGCDDMSNNDTQETTEETTSSSNDSDCDCGCENETTTPSNVETSDQTTVSGNDEEDCGCGEIETTNSESMSTTEEMTTSECMTTTEEMTSSSNDSDCGCSCENETTTPSNVETSEQTTVSGNDEEDCGCGDIETTNSESMSTTEEMPTSESMTTTEEMTTTEDMKTTEEMMTSKDMKTTEAMTTSEDMMTTEAMTTPKDMTTAEEMTTSEDMTTTEGMTTSESMPTTEDMTTTEEVTTSEDMTTTEKMTTLKDMMTSEDMKTTEKMTTSKDMQTTETMTTSVDMITTEAITTSKDMTTAEEMTTSKDMTTAKEMTTSEDMATTEVMTTSEGMTTAKEMTTSEDMATTEAMTTSEGMTTTEEMTTSEGMTTTEEMMTSNDMKTTEKMTTSNEMTTTEEMTKSTGMTTTAMETTTAAPSCPDGDNLIKELLMKIAPKLLQVVMKISPLNTVCVSVSSLLNLLGILQLYSVNYTILGILNFLTGIDINSLRCGMLSMNLLNVNISADLGYINAKVVASDSKYPLTIDFSDNLLNKLLGKVISINETDPDKSAGLINAEIDVQTGGLIKNVLSPGDLQDTAVLKLIFEYATYSKLPWQLSFDAKVQDGPFLAGPFNIVRKPFMNINAKLNFTFWKKPALKAVELSFQEGTGQSMLILLPVSLLRADELLKELVENPLLIAQIRANMSEVDVDLSLPILNVTANVNVTEVLELSNLTMWLKPGTGKLLGILPLNEQIAIRAGQTNVMITGTEGKVPPQKTTRPLFQKVNRMRCDHGFIFITLNSGFIDVIAYVGK